METGARARGLAGWARAARWCPRVLGRGSQGAERLHANDGAQREFGRAICERAHFEHVSRATNRGPHHTTRAFLIATQLFEVELTSSQQTRELFRIATFSAVLSGAIGDAAPRALPAGLYAPVMRGENLHGYHDCWDQEEDGYRDPHQGGGALLVFER